MSILKNHKESLCKEVIGYCEATPHSALKEHDVVLQLGGQAYCMTSIRRSIFSNKQGDWKTSLKYQANEGDSKVRGDKNLTQRPDCGEKEREKRMTFAKKQFGKFF